MPNWCINELTVTGPEADVAAFRAATSTEDGHLSFDRLVPMPARVAESNDLWYTWSVEHWGTKWNLADDEEESLVCLDEPGPTAGTRKIAWSFSTAWSPPVPWLESVASRYPRLEFVLWFDEPGSDFAGVTTFNDGALDDTRSWQGVSMCSRYCSVEDCENQPVNPISPAQFLNRAPTKADYQVYCQSHALAAAVQDYVNGERAAGREV